MAAKIGCWTKAMEVERRRGEGAGDRTPGGNRKAVEVGAVRQVTCPGKFDWAILRHTPRHAPVSPRPIIWPRHFCREQEPALILYTECRRVGGLAVVHVHASRSDRLLLGAFSSDLALLQFASRSSRRRFYVKQPPPLARSTVGLFAAFLCALGAELQPYSVL